MIAPQHSGLAAGPPPPGLYPDPGGSGWLRWWDGGEWTEHATPAHRAFVPPAPGSGHGANVLAIVALVTGLTGSFIAALVCGVLARRQVAGGEGTPADAKLALAGIVLGGLWALVFLAIFLLFAIAGFAAGR